MKIIRQITMSVLLAGWLSVPAVRAAESINTYQVTGPIVELTDKKIVVQKGDEKWELARDAGTKVQGDLKVGAKVTVHYRMTATKIETKNTAATEKKR
jgi:hypothetical protein